MIDGGTPGKIETTRVVDEHHAGPPHRFSVLARNTGFVLSTVIMRIAIEAPVIVDSVLFVVAAVVGFLVFWITNRLDPDLEAVDESTSSPGRGPWAKTVRVGFEPTVTRRPRRFSRPVRSTAPPRPAVAE